MGHHSQPPPSLAFSYMCLYIYFNCLSACLFVTDKRKHGKTDRAHFFVGPRMTPGMLKITIICLQHFLIFVKF